MITSQKIAEQTKPIVVRVINQVELNDLEFYVLVVAALSLIASVIIPFAQKKYEEYRTKRNFQFYFKKQLGLVLNAITTEKIEYIKPSVKDAPEKVYITLIEFAKRFQSDFKEYKEAVQPRTIFMLLMNLQNLLQFVFHMRINLSNIDFKVLTEKTLEHGKELSKDELNKAYGLILIYESFISITIFHDRFGNLKTIKRLIKENIWVGLKLEEDFLKKQNLLNEDLVHLNNNEKSIDEIISIIKIMNSKTREYFDYDKNIKKMNKGSS